MGTNGIASAHRLVRVGLAWAAAVMALSASRGTDAAVLFLEDFTSSSDWVLIFNAQGGAAGVTSQVGVGYFYVDAPNNEVAYGPDPGVLGHFIAFIPGHKASYDVSFTVTELTDSTSYDIRLDQFDANHTYLSTVYNVFPQGTFVGSTSVNLGAFTFDPSAVYVLPKVTVFTGLGNQEVAFDQLEVDYNFVPEPATVMLMGLGLWSVSAWRRRRRPPERRPVADHARA